MKEEEEDINKSRPASSEAAIILPLLEQVWKVEVIATCFSFLFVSFESSSSSIDILPLDPSALSLQEASLYIVFVCVCICGDCPIDILRSLLGLLYTSGHYCQQSWRVSSTVLFQFVFFFSPDFAQLRLLFVSFFWLVPYGAIRLKLYNCWMWISPRTFFLSLAHLFPQTLKANDKAVVWVSVVVDEQPVIFMR